MESYRMYFFLGSWWHVRSPRSRSYAFRVAVVQRVTCWMCLDVLIRVVKHGEPWREKHHERFYIWYLDVSKNRGKTPKMDDLGVPLFFETPIWVFSLAKGPMLLMCYSCVMKKVDWSTTEVLLQRRYGSSDSTYFLLWQARKYHGAEMRCWQDSVVTPTMMPNMNQ